VALLIAAPDMLEAYLDVVRPRARLTPSEWAREFRDIAPGTSPRAGRWDPEVFPHLEGVMDSFQDAVEQGKKWVLMKCGQGGGSEAVLNCWGWMQTYYPGPMLYLISKDDLAEKFGRERIGHMCETAEPLVKTFKAGRAGAETLTRKYFVDGSIEIHGGRSVLNLETSPYRAAFVDEVDSLLGEIQGRGDPIKMVEVRTNAWAVFGETIVAAFAHPTVEEHGAAKLYALSDQRRPHVECPHCRTWFWLRWDDVKPLAREGQSPQEAERDARAYVYVTPCCGAVLTDADRYRACRRVEYRSVLPPEVARSRAWVGVQFSVMVMTKPLVEIAMEYVQGLDDPGVMRVFVNKRLGEPFKVAEQETSIDTWAALEVDGYELGVVPEEVQFLTSGQDSRLLELHWVVWGWGLVRTQERALLLCGWLVDAGVQPGPAELAPLRKSLDAADLAVFDQVLYDRAWATRGGRVFRVEQGLHDSGWMPVAAYEYARMHPGRAFPSKGAAEDSRSRAPATRWSAPPTWRVGALDLAGMTTRRFVDERGVKRARLALPRDLPTGFLEHHASERLVSERGRKVWKKHTKANHWWDCTVMAYAAALNVVKFLNGKTAEERPTLKRGVTRTAPPRRERSEDDGWLSEEGGWLSE
jgi:phage terminase large subunit GpA-like protein